MNQFDRREFIKLSILTTGGISLYPNIIFASELRKLTFDEIPDYSIKSSSLSLSKLLLSKTGKTPAELSINFQNYENESGIDSLFTSKINEIDSKIATNYGAYSISRNPNLSEKEFQETLNTITTISRAGFVATLVGGSFLINPVVGAWLASAIGGGIVYDVVKDWVIVDDENNEIDIENFNASLNKLEIEVKNTQNSIDEYSKKTNEELNSLGIKISQSKEEVKAGVIDQSESVKKLVEKKFSENNDLINKLGKNVSTANNKLDIANTKLNLINANIDLTNQNIFKASQEVIRVNARNFSLCVIN